MNAVIEWFARHSVAANLLMALIVLGGLVGLSGVRTQVFPSFETDLISVTVPYLGAAPAEVERAVCARVEDRVSDLEFVERVRSVAREGLGVVTLELIEGTDIGRAVDEVKARVDAIDSFPAETEKPVIQRIEPQHQVLSVAISGQVDESTLRRLGERVRDEISALEGVTRVDLAASRDYEIAIEVSEQSLRRHNLTFDAVAGAIRRSAVDLPGGAVKAREGEILLRTDGRRVSGQEFRDISLLTRSDGTRLTVGDVATVTDGFADTGQAARFDDEPAILAQVYRVGDQDIIEVADRVKAYVDETRASLPRGLHITTWQDETSVLRGRLQTLTHNGRLGLLLVLLVLALFLQFRVAFWVALGIPVAYLGAAWVMPALDLSINIVSLFSGIVVLGMVVDDAIVVSENIYRHREMGKSSLDAAIDGAREVSVPVFFALLTTTAAFFPLLVLAGQLGKVIRVIPLIAIAILTFSLMKSLLILPSHLASLPRVAKSTSTSPWRRLRVTMDDLQNRVVQRVYVPILRVALAWRYTSLGAAIAVFVLTMGFVGGGFIKFNFFPPVEADNLVALLSMRGGAPTEVTSEALARIEEGAQQLQAELEEEGDREVVRHVLTTIGEQPFRSRQSSNTTGLPSSFEGSHLGEVNIELVPAEDREVVATRLLNRWRELVGPIPEAAELTFNASLFSSGEAIDIMLASSDLDDLVSAAEELEAALARYPGVSDVANSFRAGKRQVQLSITPEGEALGLSLADLARQVRQAFYGEEAQRIQRDRDEIKVLVRYPEEERRSLANLENMFIRLPDSSEIPFSVAGRLEPGRSLAAIERTDRRRTVNVTAALDLEVGNSNEIIADLERTALPEILARYQRMTYSLEGQQRQQKESQGSIQKSLLIALFLIYALLAVAFRSYLQPLIVMAAIPFGIIGAVWGHVLMGQDLTAFSVFGIVALTGVVVNDSLALMIFINRSSSDQSSIEEALVQAGALRFRPIVLTSLTTFVGLVPLLLEKSIQAQFLIPMVTSIAFGLLFATVIILILIPVSYLILRDLHGLGRGGAEAR